MRILEERKEYIIAYEENPIVFYSGNKKALALSGYCYFSKRDKASDIIYQKFIQLDDVASTSKTVEALGRKIMKEVKKELRWKNIV